MPGSALKPTGSTREWRKLREPYARHLANVGPLDCRRCHRPIHHGQPWQLGHPDDAPRALGGNDDDLWPEHMACGSSAGARLGAHMRALHAAQAGDLTPSRDW